MRGQLTARLCLDQKLHWQKLFYSTLVDPSVPLVRKEVEPVRHRTLLQTARVEAQLDLHSGDCPAVTVHVATWAACGYFWPPVEASRGAAYAEHSRVDKFEP